MSNQIATADFKLYTASSSRVYAQIPSKGVLLENGNFIFYIKRDGDRDMILTTNAGKTIQSGYVSVSATNWKEPKKWRQMPRYTPYRMGLRMELIRRMRKPYKLANFKVDVASQEAGKNFN